MRTGLEQQHAIAAGPMEPVVRNLATVSERDVQAIAAYVAARIGTPAPERRRAAERSLAHANRDAAAFPFVEHVPTQTPTDDQALRNGAAVYAGACAGCHDRGRLATSGAALHLALGSAITIPTSTNLIRITLEGIVPSESEPARWMPGFAGALTDTQVRDLVHYIRVHFGRAPPWRDVNDELRKAKADMER
jgi:mono/diheme cytochrome c family protein